MDVSFQGVLSFKYYYNMWLRFGEPVCKYAKIEMRQKDMETTVLILERGQNLDRQADRQEQHLVPVTISWWGIK